MEAGRELDALVAEKVMGHKVKWGRSRFYPLDYDTPFFDEQPLKRSIPNYSTDIAAAWEVVEKLKEQTAPERDIEIGCYSFYRVSIVDAATEAEIAVMENDSAPLAICLAALKALAVAV